MRVVCDPNVLVSALISSDGPPRVVVDAREAGDIELVVCPHLLGELEGVLLRQKILRLVGRDRIAPYIDGLVTGADGAADPVAVESVSADPDDDYLVALAESNGVDYLISGDKHLTELDDLSVPALTPRQFVDLHL